MFSLRTVVAGATLALAGVAQAWHTEYPPCLDPFQPYVAAGCYQDGVAGGSGSALIYRSGQNQYNMTVEKCVAECKGNGFRYAGLKYYGVCYCGSTVGGAQLDDSKCSYPCTGNQTQTCGSDNALSIWQDPTFKTTDLGGVVTNLPGVIKSIAGYKPSGCYTDNSSKGRALTWPMDVDGSKMTPSTCLNACADQGFPLAGLEYGGECYCGNVLANDTVKANVDDCNVPCNGDKTLLCGGPSRLSVYISNDLLSLQPCGWTPSGSSSSSSLSSTSTTSASTSTSSTSTSTSSVSSVSSVSSSSSSSTTTLSTIVSSTTNNGPNPPPSSTNSGPNPPPSSTTNNGPNPPPSSTNSGSNPPPSSTTNNGPNPPPSSTTTNNGPNPPPGTTTTTSCTTTTGPAMCTSTVVVPNTCEYKCGNWCAPSVPDFQDQNSCQTAYNNCAKNIASCFQNAGWPGVLNCFDFSKWCDGLQGYCASTCSRGRNCNKAGCFNNNAPSGGNNVKTTTSVYPCAATSTSTTASSASTSCAPQPTNICSQPSSRIWGYGPGNPVGGIELPLVACNDLKSDFSQNPFKLYTDTNSNSCSSYRRNQQSSACADACKTQYTACLNTYVQSCKKLNTRSEGSNYFDKRSHSHFHKRALEKSGIEPRWFNFFGNDQWQTAQTKCGIQYTDCLSENRNVYFSNRCQNFGTGI
ncbi:hypothetical protein NW752_005026 [Fusarium irregulare]|uniref:WSC domain-containing protein n=1 Tax=Fusarium irregulare TaxID=2494466 RepID=A0A9W8PMW0_9HYPO|nr:hypothetical protein NW766_008220 [Fusarium irregulare]KAJ4019925.1 hypothetical protein NW752_005026 [Fusarium irregulare]